MEQDPWASTRHDPRLPEHAGLRASDADRDVVLGVLGEAYADGRLTHDEHDERAGAVARARHLGELPGLLSDLLPAGLLMPGAGVGVPAGVLRQRAEAEYRRKRREALWGFLSASLICWVIWLAVNLADPGDAFPWPLLVMLGTLLNVGRVLFQREEITRDEVRRLERRARKRQQRGLPPLAD